MRTLLFLLLLPLAFASHAAAQGAPGNTARLAWVDRAGNVVGHIGQPMFLILDPAISPDGRRVASRGRGQQGDIDQAWIHEGTTSRRLTETSGLSERHTMWSPDGARIAYSVAPRGSVSNLWVMRPDGSDNRRLVTTDEMNTWFPAWTPDQSALVFHTAVPGQDVRDLMYLRVSDGSLHPLVDDDGLQALPRVSPDGRYVAYSSDETGTWEVFVTTFPAGDRKWQVSRGGGTWARWGGDELFFWSGDTLMAVEVETGEAFSSGTPRPLFRGPAVGMGDGPQEGYNPAYDVSRDGTRFVVVQNARQPGG